MRKKVWLCRGERKNHEAGCSLGNFSLLGTLVYHSKNLFKDWYLKMLLDQRQTTVSRECSTVLFLCNQNFWLSLCNLWRRVNTRWTAYHWLLASNLLCMIELLHKMLSPQFQLVPLSSLPPLALQTPSAWCTYTSSMYHVNHTLRSMSLLAVEDSYFLGSCNVSTVVLHLRESISFWVPSSPMESSRKSSTFNDLFSSSISANAVAPLIPIGLHHSLNSCSLLFVHRAFANRHAPSDLIWHSLRLR